METQLTLAPGRNLRIIDKVRRESIPPLSDMATRSYRSVSCKVRISFLAADSIRPSISCRTVGVKSLGRKGSLTGFAKGSYLSVIILEIESVFLSMIAGLEYR
jgi:hypothetical protein